MMGIGDLHIFITRASFLNSTEECPKKGDTISLTYMPDIASGL